MKRFFSFVRKEFYHILRDHRTLMILIGMPVVQILLFGFAITNEIREAPVAFIGDGGDEITFQLRDKILASDYFVSSGAIYHEEEVEQIFRDGKTKLIVVFEPDFSRKLITEGSGSLQLIADATEPNTANTLVSYVNAILADYTNYLNNDEDRMMIHAESRMVYNPQLKGVYYFVPGIIVVLLMLISAMMTSISIAREKELGTMEVLLASPMQPFMIILAKVVPYFLLSFIDAALILLLGKFIFGVPVVGNISLLIGVTVLFILLALSLGILISTIAETQQTALLLSLMGLMLPTILLSGFIFPVENMPWILQVISNVVPPRWFIVIVKSIMLKGASLSVLWKEILILVGFIIVFVSISVRKFKVRLE